MTFKHYVDLCKKVLKKNPECAELPVLYSTDDEGNSYSQVIFTPGGLVVDDPESNRPEPVNPEGRKPNAVCIN